MLAPRQRTLLLDALRPPTGFRLDRAVATTYTLDLVALLTAPLAFTFADAHDEEGRLAADPLALLEGLRRHARRIHVFCNAGGIRPPRPGQQLLSQLEESVVEVVAPRGGVFHPKLWLLRFVEHEGERRAADDERAVCHRLVVGTRNLTFDRSWDSVLVLDEEPGGGKAARERNEPLVRLLTALPSMAVGPVSAECRDAVASLAADIRDVVWDVPSDFDADELRFHVFGLDGAKPVWPFDKEGRRLVMAPFVDGWFLDKFVYERQRNILIGRSEELSEVPSDACRRYDETYVLAADADPEDEDREAGEDAAVGDAGAEVEEDSGGAPPNGLHAKLFIVERHRHAHVFTGSANATRAAFESNIEVLVELVGGSSTSGLGALLGEKSGAKGTLRDLLEPWTPPDAPPVGDAERRQLERDVEALQDRIARADLRVLAAARDPGGDVDLVLQGTWPAHDAAFVVTCRPASLPAQRAREVAGAIGAANEIARFETSLLDATAFFVFDVTGRRANRVHRVSFARRLPIDGLPDDRAERLLRSLLRDKAAVARLLALLLGGDELDIGRMRALVGGATGAGDGAHSIGGLPLLEGLVRAVERGKESLEPVRRLVEDLSRTPEGRALLPDGFERIWTPIQRASEELHA